MTEKIRTIFFGTPEFSVPALEALLNNKRFDLVGVVTQPDRPVGRKKMMTPSPVKIAASKHGLTVLQPEKLKDEAIEQIMALKPELAVVVAYGNLIPKKLIDSIKLGFINIHPSLLPKHRGASPLTAAILEGDKETGVCLMVLDEAMDHGPVIACRRIPLNGDETTTLLTMILTPIGADMLGKELVEYLDGKIGSKPQDHDQASFCKTIGSEDGRIDWSRSKTEIEHLIRAMNGVTPAWTMLEGKTLLIHRARISNDSPGEAVGTLTEQGNNMAVAVNGGYILVDELQLSGGKPMPGRAFLNGHKDKIGTILK